MHLVLVFATGLLFGIGLIVSGLTDPAKVLAFLDLAGAWDPSLLFVMAGAALVAAVGFRLARGRGQFLLGAPLRLPTPGAIDRRLVLGSVVFGVGWGLAGFCPGPALVAMGAGYVEALVFSAAMVAGMANFEVAEWLRRRARPGEPA
jgi:uncharacterized membrane protein YedE/YeeE